MRSYLIHSNLFIAVGAAVSTAQTLWILDDQLIWHPLILIVLFGSLAMYILHRSIGLRRVLQNVRSIPQRFKPVMHRRLLFILAGIVSAGICLYLLIAECTVRTLWLFLPPMLISFLYAVPVLGGQRLRDFGAIKVPLLALVWAVITALIPLQTVEWPISVEGYLLFGERFFLLMAITLPFEVRDRKVDIEEGVTTLVHVLGVPGLRGLAIGCALLGLMLSMLLYVHHLYDVYLLIALLLSWIIAIAVISGVSGDRSAVYYEVGLDGLLIVQALCVFGAIFF